MSGPGSWCRPIVQSYPSAWRCSICSSFSPPLRPWSCTHPGLPTPSPANVPANAPSAAAHRRGAPATPAAAGRTGVPRHNGSWRQRGTALRPHLNGNRKNSPPAAKKNSHYPRRTWLKIRRTTIATTMTERRLPPYNPASPHRKTLLPPSAAVPVTVPNSSSPVSTIQATIFRSVTPPGFRSSPPPPQPPCHPASSSPAPLLPLSPPRKSLLPARSSIRHFPFH